MVRPSWRVTYSRCQGQLDICWTNTTILDKSHWEYQDCRMQFPHSPFTDNVLVLGFFKFQHWSGELEDCTCIGEAWQCPQHSSPGFYSIEGSCQKIWDFVSKSSTKISYDISMWKLSSVEVRKVWPSNCNVLQPGISEKWLFSKLYGYLIECLARFKEIHE